MNKVEKIHIGKAKRVYTTDDPETLILSFKDDATAAGGLKRGSIRGKGAANAYISTMLFGLLEQHGVRTHCRGIAVDRDMAVRKLEMMPLEVVIRNIAAGSFTSRFRIPEGTILKKPVVEFDYLNEALGDPMVNRTHIRALSLASDTELEEMESVSRRVNDILRSFFAGIGIDLVDFKLEFGRDAEGHMIVADEISPDTCRLWDTRTHEKLDKDRFRYDMGEVSEAYRDVYERITAWAGNSEGTAVKDGE